MSTYHLEANPVKDRLKSEQKCQFSSHNVTQSSGTVNLLRTEFPVPQLRPSEFSVAGQCDAAADRDWLDLPFSFN